MKTLLLTVLLVLTAFSPALAWGGRHHHGGGPIIVVPGPVYWPVPYPVPVPVCTTLPGHWVWDGVEWVWVSAQVMCS